jgi:thioredoxin 1
MSGGFDNQAVRYEMSLSMDEAKAGTKKILTRQGKKLEVTIPLGSGDGTIVKLTNALQVTDNRPGDILITVRTKDTQASVVAIDDATFTREVLQSGLPVVVDFWASWCGPCRMIAPIMDNLASRYSGRMKFCKINVDENPASASQFQAMSIPLLVFFKDGAEVERSVGALPESELRSKIEQVLS